MARDVSPISLYFDLPKGVHADLEVVARATLQWASIIREIATIVAPGVEFEIELVETEDGSLWLSSLLKALHEGDRKALAAIVWGVLVFFAMGPALHLQADFGNKFWETLGHKDFADLSQKDKMKLADDVAAKVIETTANQRRQSMILEAEKDRNIIAIGVDQFPNAGKPVVLIPRDDFPFYDSDLTPGKVIPVRDTTYRNNVRVKITRANLREGEIRPRWRFEEGGTEWSADIADFEFVEALNSTATGLPLAVGQIMIVDLAIDTKLVDGAWEETNRRIVRVIRPPVGRRQQNLDLGG